MLESYWYGPINKLEGKRRDMEMQEALEDEIMRERKETPSADELATAGTDLMKTVRTFLTKFEKLESPNLQRRTRSSRTHLEAREKELNPVEQRAMTAVIGYLRAKKMR